jgi:natural product biosynthesis luciferase-like monooxygenase protein/amino acid adenylation domain-containing protein
MSIIEIKAHLQRHQASLQLRDGQLMLWGSRSARRDTALLDLIKAHRATLIAGIGDGERFDFSDGADSVPPSRIPPGSESITADMLPLLQASQDEVDQIVASVAGGAAAIQDIYPLTPLQEGMLFHYLMANKGDPYLLWSMMAFVDRAALDAYVAAYNQVVARHDILRTVLRWDSLREPVQVVLRQARLVVRTVELDPADGSVADQLKARFDPTHFRIDLREAPLATLVVARDEAHDRWVGMHFAHHLTTDRASGDIIDSEVRAFMRGDGHQMPEPVPYRNFVAAMQQGLTRADHEMYFQRLLGTVAHTTAPFGLLDVHRDGSQIQTLVRALDEQASQRVLNVARGIGVGAASILHAAWGHVLGRICGVDQAVFGTVLFGRMSGGRAHERVMGPSINTLPLVVDMRVPLLDSIKGVQNHLADLLLHEHASLPLAQKQAALPKDVPLFTSVMNYRHSGVDDRPLSDPLAAADNKVTFLGGHEGNNYPLTISVDDFGQTFRLTVQAARGIDPQLVLTLLQTSIAQITEALEQNRATGLAALPVLSEAARLPLLQQWAGAVSPYPEECVHVLVERQTDLTPEAIAVRAADRQLSYREVDQYANQIAHRLLQQGVAPGDVIGMCMSRSLEQVATLLALLKTGALVLPLDPDYPRERLALLLEDSQCRLVLSAGTATEMAAAQGLPHIAVDRLNLSGLSQARPSVPLTLEHSAYLLYTSGSTGVPKGVTGRHRTLTSRLWPERAQATGSERYAHKSSINFIDSFWEVLMPLLGGGLCVVFPNEVVKDPAAFVALLEREAISHLVLVPTLLAALLSQLEGAGGALPALRYCVSSGEPLSRELALRFGHLLPHARLVNIYGTTEFWDATAHAVSARDNEALAYLGKPMPNVQIYVLDAQMDMVPAGVEGELYVVTPGLTTGYLNREELSRRSFVPCPYLPGRTMYKTGDKVRWLDQQGLQYLGRTDQQIKLHGYRIEPEEIEGVLVALPDVAEAVVVEQEDEGHRRLAAYVVPTSAQAGGAPMGFGLFYFSDAGTAQAGDAMTLYLETLKEADRLGFNAIWTPERHFTEVGAAFPNPAVLSAAAAMVTERIQLRSGSVVLPLHNPVRVAEEWAVVDQLSKGRVELSFASGWVPNDFVLAPDNFADRHAVLMDGIEKVRTLWRGDALSLRNGIGAQADIRIQPPPVQAELPVWVTAAGATQTFIDAGRAGVNLLTHALNTTIGGLAEKIALYRQARRDAGFDPQAGKVALMLHTYVLDDAEAARAEARPHLQRYFRSQLALRQDVGRALGLEVGIDAEVTEDVLTLATERYLASKALIGSPESCADLMREVQDAGVDEIACLIDFGLSLERIQPALLHLDRLRRATARRPRPQVLREHLRQQLPAFMVPAQVTVLDRLPLTPSGKIDRRALRAIAAQRIDASAYIAPRNPAEQKLASIWENVLRVKQVGITDRFLDLGGNSMAAIRVINQAQKELGLKISLRTLFEKQTIQALDVAAISAVPLADNSALLRLKAGDGGSPLFCFHGGAGTASYYSKLAKHLAPEDALYAFQYPPLLSGGPDYADVPALAAEFLAVMRQVQPSGPYRLLGWSFGGLTAFEIACQLHAAGETVDFLCLIDAHLGDVAARGRTVTHEQTLHYVLKLHGVPDSDGRIVDGGINAVLAALKQADVVPESFASADLARSLATIQHLVQLRTEYQPGTYDGNATFIEAHRTEALPVDAAAPWRSKVAGRLEVVGVNASHYRMFDEPYVDELGQAVRRAQYTGPLQRHRAA